jgi:hypothetical protein
LYQNLDFEGSSAAIYFIVVSEMQFRIEGERIWLYYIDCRKSAGKTALRIIRTPGTNAGKNI